MTQDNPHNEMPKDTVEELIKEFNRKHLQFRSEGGFNVDNGIDYEAQIEWLRSALTTAYNKGVEVGRVEEGELTRYALSGKPEALDLLRGAVLTPLPDKSNNIGQCNDCFDGLHDKCIGIDYGCGCKHETTPDKREDTDPEAYELSVRSGDVV